MKKYLIIAFSCCIFLSGLYCQGKNGIITPEKFFGFQPGDQGMLIKYQPLTNYLKKIDEASPRVKMIEIGESPMGNKMYVVFLSSEENIKNLESLRQINEELTLNADIDPEEKEKYIREGKVFILTTLSMHSNEVGPTQSAPLLAYEIAETNDPELLSYLDEVVLMMVPCHNPDGLDMIVDHYNKYKNTTYEGSTMPGIYHKYTGHDNNRDFVSLTQSDNKAIARLYNKTWFPHVLVEKHQMYFNGPRYLVQPVHDPITENINEQLWSWTWLLGSAMAKDMTEKGLAGVSQHYLIDDYWPGSTCTASYKNVIGLFTECASVKYATPVFIEPDELKVLGKGLSEYKKSINMPLPWEGGWWKLSDIIQYEMASFYSIIKTAAIYKKEILKFKNDLCQIEVRNGKTEAPYYFVFPSEQHDPGELVNLINLLDEHGINVYKPSVACTIDGIHINENCYVVPLSQPFRAFLIEVLKKQDYPVRHYTPGGEIMRPYDITSWSLPLHRGVKIIELNTYSEDLNKSLARFKLPIEISNPVPDDYAAVILPAQYNDSYRAAFKALNNKIEVERLTDTINTEGKKIMPGSFIIYYNKSTGEKTGKIISELNIAPEYIKSDVPTGTKKIIMPRIGLVESYFHDMDAGWTRFIFDSYNINYRVLRPAEIATKGLEDEFDVLVFPDMDDDLLKEGKPKAPQSWYATYTYPPDYAKGMGDEGIDKLMNFVNQGGMVISWGRSAGLFTGPLTMTGENGEKEEFQLPVSDISENLQKQGLLCPGSLLKIKLNKNHPMAYGMPAYAGAFSRCNPVLTTSIPWFDMDRRVIASLPEKNIVLSGYAENEELIANKPIVVWLKKGKGQLVLSGFQPQLRASTPGTYKLLFNALLLPATDN
jgi:hypothetical protein